MSQRINNAKGQQQIKDRTFDIAAAPTQPGCYLMRDAHGKILYVGKAKNLRARLRNYINETDSRYSVPFLMRRVAHIEFLVVDTEKEALLLENTLIKTHKPRYNVRLRDDKTFISIRLDPREHFPRMTVVRRYKKDGARYFGPYHDSRAARKTMKQMQRLIPLRVCSDHVMRNRARPCIYHQMKQCLAPCTGQVSPETYSELTRQAIMVLEGRGAALEKRLRFRIEELAEALKFEEAAVLRDRLRDLQATMEPQRAIVSGAATDRDIFGYYAEGNFIEIQALYYRNGAMVGGNAFAFDHIEAPLTELLGSFLLQYYDATPAVPKEVTLPLAIDDQDTLAEILSEKKGSRVTIHYPKRGAQARMVALANSNARRAFLENRGREKALADALEQVRVALRLEKAPERIECFDVSTHQGDKTVAAMVVFERGLPAKKKYRRYEIAGVRGGDDFAAMRETLERRYKRALKENDLPDLVLIDGGKGHLNVAVAVLKSLGLERVPCASIAKSRRTKESRSLERFFIPGRMNPVAPSQKGAAVLLLARVRDEAHRFAITYHRKKRKRSALTTALLDIPGVGPGRARALLNAFGSLSRIRVATREQLAAVPGISGKLAEEISAALDAEK